MGKICLFLSPSEVLGDIAGVLSHLRDQVLLRQVHAHMCSDCWCSCIAASPDAL